MVLCVKVVLSFVFDVFFLLFVSLYYMWGYFFSILIGGGLLTIADDYTRFGSIPSQTAGVSPVVYTDWNTYVRATLQSLKYGHIVGLRTDLVSTDAGVMVYDTSDSNLYVYSGSAWKQVPKFGDAFSGTSGTFSGALVAASAAVSGALTARTGSFTGTNAADVVATFKNAASPTANLVEFKNSAGTLLSSVSSAGAFVGSVTGNTTGTHTGSVVGNVTGNVTGSSGSCSGNATSATSATSATNASYFTLGSSDSFISAPNGLQYMVFINQGDSRVTGNAIFKVSNVANSVYDLAVTGRSVIVNTTNTLGTTASARRYKERISNYNFDINKILAMQPVEFYWNRDMVEWEDERDVTTPQYGFIAEDALAAGANEFIIYNSKGEIMSFDYDRFSIALLSVCKEQQIRIDDLEARLVALEAK